MISSVCVCSDRRLCCAGGEKVLLAELLVASLWLATTKKKRCGYYVLFFVSLIRFLRWPGEAMLELPASCRRCRKTTVSFRCTRMHIIQFRNHCPRLLRLHRFHQGRATFAYDYEIRQLLLCRFTPFARHTSISRAARKVLQRKRMCPNRAGHNIHQKACYVGIRHKYCRLSLHPIHIQCMWVTKNKEIVFDCSARIRIGWQIYIWKQVWSNNSAHKRWRQTRSRHGMGSGKEPDFIWSRPTWLAMFDKRLKCNESMDNQTIPNSPISDIERCKKSLERHRRNLFSCQQQPPLPIQPECIACWLLERSSQLCSKHGHLRYNKCYGKAISYGRYGAFKLDWFEPWSRITVAKFNSISF